MMPNIEITNKSTNTKIAKEHIEQVFQQLIDKAILIFIE